MKKDGLMYVKVFNIIRLIMDGNVLYLNII